MATFIKSGWGFDVGLDFTRATADMPIELAPKEYAKPGHVIGYVSGNPESKLGFMRAPRIRVHCRKDGIIER